MTNDAQFKPQARIGVVLVNWNSDEVTILCVQSLMRGKRVPDCIVIVDNASQARSVERIIESCPTAHIIRNNINYGFTGGNNVGLGYLLKKDYDYAWILNNDTEVTPNCLSLLETSLLENPGVAAVTGKIYYYGKDRLLWFAGVTFNRFTFKIGHRGLGEVDNGQYDLAEKIDFFDGCSLLVRCAVLKRVGLFDNHFFAYNEDLDLAFRMKQDGFSILYNPQAVLYHKIGSSISKNDFQAAAGGTSTPLQQFLANRNRIYIARKYANTSQKIISISLIILKALFLTFVMILLNRKQKAIAVWSGIFHGILDDIQGVMQESSRMPY